MRKRRAILVCAVCAGFLAAIALINRDDGPTYKGRTLYAWLKIRAQAGSAFSKEEEEAEAADAVTNIGTNALPWLVEQIRRQGSPGDFAHQMDLAIAHLPKSIGGKLSRIRPLTAERRSAVALEGFQLLGTNAAPAVPALRKIIANTKSQGPAEAALLACVYIGKAALPAVTEVITNSQHPERGLAITVAGGMDNLGTNTSELIRVLELCASDPDASIAEQANTALDLLTNTGASASYTIPISFP